MQQLNAIDWFLIGLYFATIFAVAFWSGRGRASHGDSGDYFLAGRNIGWFVVGASLFASNIGSEHLVGLAGTGAASGIAVAQFELLAALILVLLGWFFVPFYLKSGVFTMPEFLERRYSPGARWYLAIVSIAGYVLTKISVTIAAGGIVFSALMGIDFWTGAVIVVLATGVYTIYGGLRAVMYTDMVQMFILIAGAVLVTVAGLDALGGWGEMTRIAGPQMMSIWQPASHPDFPWTGILLGAPILGIWYWCTDQYIVQRVLAAKNCDEAVRGALFAGYLKLLPLFIFVVPGVIAFALAQSGKLQLSDSDQALPALVAALLPEGVRGLVVAGLLAALMSSLSSVFNSCSTLVTWDVYRKLHPQASESRLVLVGRLSTVFLVVLGLAWIPLMKLISGQLYTYLQSVQAYIAPPIAAVFLIGIMSRRVNGFGAMTALIGGGLLGLARLVAELNKDALDGWLLGFASINFLHFAAMLFVVCSAILVLASLARPAPDRATVDLLTISGETLDHRSSPQFRVNLALTLGLLAAVATIWIVF
jgi:SSS family solute:Na+ symporter